MNYQEIIKEVIDQHKVAPIDMRGIGDAAGEFAYLNSHKNSYIRTVADIDRLLGGGNKTVLEIGSFLGPVSISLRKLGYRVYAQDIPEYHASAALRALYQKNDIPFAGINLRKYKLPYDSDSFDAIVMCETMEHLNFNPLPILAEINRVLKKDGLFYIGMPNQAALKNRLKMLIGRSVHNPIGDFFKQLDRQDNTIVGLHWREYTINETVQIIESMGFKTIAKYFYLESLPKDRLKALAAWAAYRIPSFRPSQIVIGQKIDKVCPDFYLTEANS
jgi:SAM-dependent methyltransferase